MDEANNLQPPPKRTYFLNYMGQINLHRVYSPIMSRWITATVKYRRKLQFCALSIDQKNIQVSKENKVLIDLNEQSSVVSDTASNANASNGLTSVADSSHPLATVDGVIHEEPYKHSDGSLPLEILLDQVVEVILAAEFERRCVSIMLDKGSDSPLECHVFYDEDISLVSEVGETLRKFVSWHKKWSTDCCRFISKNVKLEDLDSVRFEVMLLGKLQVKHEQQPFNFVDEAVNKYHSLEIEHASCKEKLSKNKTESKHDDELPPLTSNIPNTTVDESSVALRFVDRRPSWDETRQRCNSTDITQNAAMLRKAGRTRHCSEPSTAATMGFNKNKTRLLQIGKQSVTLICPDMSSRSLEIQFINILRCSKGMEYKDHFGVFVKDHTHSHNNSNAKEDFKFKCYLFKCSEDSVCDEIMQAMRQACNLCVHGPDPLKTYHSLCKRIRSMSGSCTDSAWIEKAMNSAAKCAADSFNDIEQRKIKMKIDESCKQVAPRSNYEHLVLVMETTRQLFEDKQVEHDYRLKQLKENAQTSSTVSKKLTMFKSRAKKSFTSFENLIGKGIQKMHELQHEAEHHIASPVEKLKFTFAETPRSAPSTPVSNHSNTNRVRNLSGSPATFTDVSPLADNNDSKNVITPEPIRPRSQTTGSADQEKINVRRKLELDQSNCNPLQSQLVGNVAAVSNLSLRSLSSESTPIQSRSPTPFENDSPSQCKHFASGKKLTMHQEIFYKVGTPTKKRNGSKSFESSVLSEYMRPVSALNTPEAVRLAWRRAIHDQMILNRITKIKPTTHSSSSSSVNGYSVPVSMKLHYSESDVSPPEMNAVWEELLETDDRGIYKLDQSVLRTAVRKGVPIMLRGRVWSLLYEQWKLQQQEAQLPPIKSFAIDSTPYDHLLKNLTTHQHAILIDLGRTFPSYPYFSQQLGNGQLELFNVLKAYSLADGEVGYCQGLSFVAGLLLMHMYNGNEAYHLLCHLMVGVGCRKLYLPDMAALRVAVYQLSRLLHDFHKDLYDHLEKNEVTLMLFAAPWFLTMFTSILSFGFTARIFDLIFLEGTNALFKVALCLLSYHKQKILQEDGFEKVVCYLKTQLPDMKDDEVKRVLNDIFDLNITEKLRIYEVEYAVLEDGETFGANNDDQTHDASKDIEQKYTRLEQVHQTVTKYNVELVGQLEAARMQISSLQRGLTDMAALDEKKTLELDTLRHEIELLKRNK